MPQQSGTRADAAERPPGDAPAGGNTRRGVLLGAGIAGLAGVAAACGDSGGGGDAGGSGGEAGSGEALASAGEIPVGGGKVFKDAEVVVCQPAQGEFKAYSAACTHRGCSVDSVSGGTINCPCHGSKFKIADGSVLNPPAEEPLEERRITVEGDKIILA